MQTAAVEIEKVGNRVLQETIKDRMQVLENIVTDKTKEIKKAPKGLVNIAKTDKRVRYYYKKSSSSKKRKYLKQEEHTLIAQLCQKDYDERVVKAAKKELQILKQMYEAYPAVKAEDVYEKLHRDRKVHVMPIVLSDEEFVADWEAVEYQGNTYMFGNSDYYTERGERVRSKTEILIANALNRNNIPYRYEYPLYLSGYNTVYPDFTVLNVKKRKEYYWEHLGMMDEPSYVEKALNKLRMYERNNIYPGDNLILTHETAANPIDSRSIEQMIQHYLL